MLLSGLHKPGAPAILSPVDANTIRVAAEVRAAANKGKGETC
jgi:hypothetical protein